MNQSKHVVSAIGLAILVSGIVTGCMAEGVATSGVAEIIQLIVDTSGYAKDSGLAGHDLRDIHALTDQAMRAAPQEVALRLLESREPNAVVVLTTLGQRSEMIGTFTNEPGSSNTPIVAGLTALQEHLSSESSPPQTGSYVLEGLLFSTRVLGDVLANLSKAPTRITVVLLSDMVPQGGGKGEAAGWDSPKAEAWMEAIGSLTTESSLELVLVYPDAEWLEDEYYEATPDSVLGRLREEVRPKTVHRGQAATVLPLPR